MKRATALVTSSLVGGAGALGVPLSPAAAADGDIVIDRNINSIRIGNKQRVVQNKLGAPRRVTTGTNDFGMFKILHYPDRFSVTINQFRGAVDITTRSATPRTAAGVGVGSTKAQVRASVRVACTAVPGQARQQVCESNTPKAGRTTTVFRLRSGVVTEVQLLTLLD